MDLPKFATTQGSALSVDRLDVPRVPPWPEYKGESQLVDTSPNRRATVYVDPRLDQQGLQNAQELLREADRIAEANDALFGFVGRHVDVIIIDRFGKVDGTGGAVHGSCNYETGSAIEVCASFGNSARVIALFEAELSECSMGGNLCQRSTGEALSRWCAMVIGNNVLRDFATAHLWYKSGKPDFVTQTSDEKNDNAVGCGMAFLSWLMSQGCSLSQIARQMVVLGGAATLAQLYAEIMNDVTANAWPKFEAAVDRLGNGIGSDDPFLAAGQLAQQLVHMHPSSIDLAGKVFSSILSGIATGRDADHILCNARALLSTSLVGSSPILGNSKISKPSASRRKSKVRPARPKSKRKSLTRTKRQK
jgi:hypothetical protein